MNQDNKINIKLKRNKDDMNSWEVNDFLNRLSNTSYKYEILNEIGMRINNGLKPENIVILSNSFDFALKYRNLKNRRKIDLHKESDVIALYHLGSPISFFPNSYIYRFNYIFQVFREINELLRKSKCNRLGKDLLYQYARYDLNDIILKIKEDSIRKFKEKDNDANNLFERKLENIINKYTLKRNTYENDRLEFDKVLNLKEHEIEDDYKEKYYYIEGKYFNAFSKLFSKLDRPIVGIYDDENKNIEILCINYIYRANNSENGVEIREITHNSPLLFNLVICATMAPSIYGLIKSIKVNNENSKIESSNSKLKSEQYKKIDEMERDLKDLKASLQISNIDSMGDSYFKDILVKIKGNLENKSITNFKNNKLDNNNIVINIDDYKRRKNKITFEEDAKCFSSMEIYEIIKEESPGMIELKVSEDIFNLNVGEDCYLVELTSKDIFKKVIAIKFYVGNRSLNMYNTYDYKLISSLGNKN